MESTVALLPRLACSLLGYDARIDPPAAVLIMIKYLGVFAWTQVVDGAEWAAQPERCRLNMHASRTGGTV